MKTEYRLVDPAGFAGPWMDESELRRQMARRPAGEGWELQERPVLCGEIVARPLPATGRVEPGDDIPYMAPVWIAGAIAGAVALVLWLVCD